jgi:hypothetical protein
MWRVPVSGGSPAGGGAVRELDRVWGRGPVHADLVCISKHVTPRCGFAYHYVLPLTELSASNWWPPAPLRLAPLPGEALACRTRRAIVVRGPRLFSQGG